MKPRLGSAPLTDEDLRIWMGGGRRRGLFGYCVGFGNCLDSDRRDADLMLLFMVEGFVEVISADKNGVFCVYDDCRMPRLFDRGPYR